MRLFLFWSTLRISFSSSYPFIGARTQPPQDEFFIFYIDFCVLLQISFHKPTRNYSRDLLVSGGLSRQPHRLSALSFHALPQPLVESLKAGRVHYPALPFARINADSLVTAVKTLVSATTNEEKV